MEASPLPEQLEKESVQQHVGLAQRNSGSCAPPSGTHAATLQLRLPTAARGEASQNPCGNPRGCRTCVRHPCNIFEDWLALAPPVQGPCRPAARVWLWSPCNSVPLLLRICLLRELRDCEGGKLAEAPIAARLWCFALSYTSLGCRCVVELEPSQSMFPEEGQQTDAAVAPNPWNLSELHRARGWGDAWEPCRPRAERMPLAALRAPGTGYASETS